MDTVVKDDYSRPIMTPSTVSNPLSMLKFKGGCHSRVNIGSMKSI